MAMIPSEGWKAIYKCGPKDNATYNELPVVAFDDGGDVWVMSDSGLKRAGAVRYADLDTHLYQFEYSKTTIVPAQPGYRLAWKEGEPDEVTFWIVTSSDPSNPNAFDYGVKPATFDADGDLNSWECKGYEDPEGPWLETPTMNRTEWLEKYGKEAKAK